MISPGQNEWERTIFAAPRGVNRSTLSSHIASATLMMSEITGRSKGALGAVIIALGLCAVPDDAWTLPSEGHFWGGLGAANIGHAAPSAFGWWGPSAHLGGIAHINDFWRLSADLSVSHHFAREIEEESTGPHTVAGAALGIRYAFDIATYVPYAEFSVAVHPLGPPSSGSNAGELLSARATLGVDYRKSRRWSMGTAITLHAPVSDPSDFPHYSGLRFHVGYHFQRF